MTVGRTAVIGYSISTRLVQVSCSCMSSHMEPLSCHVFSSAPPVLTGRQQMRSMGVSTGEDPEQGN